MESSVTTKVILLLISFILLSCSRHSIILPEDKNYRDLPEISGYTKDRQKECSRRYHWDKIWIVEIACDSEDIKNGIYVVDRMGVRFFDWFDKEFNAWDWNEGCSDESSCFYEVSLNERGEGNRSDP